MERALRAVVRTGWLGSVAEPVAEAILSTGKWRGFADREVI